MSVTKAQFDEFSRRMDERHTRYEELHMQLIKAIEEDKDQRACAVHSKDIDELKSDRDLVKGAMKVALFLGTPTFALLIGWIHKKLGGHP